jgi:hypothetical protein
MGKMALLLWAQRTQPAKAPMALTSGPATPAHAQSVCCAHRERGRFSLVVLAAMARWRTKGHRVWSDSIYEIRATRCYIGSYTGHTGERVSMVRWRLTGGGVVFSVAGVFSAVGGDLESFPSRWSSSRRWWTRSCASGRGGESWASKLGQEVVQGCDDLLTEKRRPAVRWRGSSLKDCEAAMVALFWLRG